MHDQLVGQLSNRLVSAHLLRRGGEQCPQPCPLAKREQQLTRVGARVHL